MTSSTTAWRQAVAVVAAITLLLGGCGDAGSSAEPADRSTTTTPTTTTTAAPTSTSTPTVERLRTEVVERRDSDPTVFTQGLELHDGALLISGGLYGESTIRSVDPDTGDVHEKVALPDDLFAEGLTVVDDNVVVLTWQEQTALVLDATTLERRDAHTYEGEGWGLCDDGERLVMSDGSATLQFRDRQTFEPDGSVAVTLDGRPLTQLNELECVGDAVWANVWHQDTIVRIDPDTGRVTAVVDASSLVPDSVRADPEAVLNGIAHDPTIDTFLVTGKNWPTLFVVRFVPAG